MMVFMPSTTPPPQLMSTLQLPGEKGYKINMFMHTGTRTYDVSLAREFQKHLSNVEHKHGLIDQGKHKKGKVNESSKKGNIMFRRILMLCTKMLRCFVIQTSFHHCNFVVHQKNRMVSGGWLSITIWYLIQQIGRVICAISRIPCDCA